MKRILYFLCILLFSNQLWAWGSKGHMIVAQIAQNELSETAKQNIKTLLSGEDIIQVCNWADAVKERPEWIFSKPWHFVDLNDDEQYEDIPQTEEGNVVSAINQMILALKSKSTPITDKAVALKFLVHFMGDIHQPLHVGRPTDHGGNDVKIIFDGKNSTLHGLWDSGIIRRSPLGYQEYAIYLQTQNPFVVIQENSEIAFTQIIQENISSRAQIYNFSLASVEPISISESYIEHNKALLDTRLLLGGKRLGALLNDIFN